MRRNARTENSDEAQSQRRDVGEYSIVVKAVVFRGDRVLLMRRSDYIPSMAGDWDIPGGVLHRGEAPVAGLAREALEEAGIAIAVGECLDCYWFGAVGRRDHLGLTFCAQYVGGEIRASAEHTHVSWYPLASLPSDLPPWIGDLVRRASGRPGTAGNPEPTTPGTRA